MAKVAICIPTIRPESFKTFIAAWDNLFAKHNVELYVMQDLEDHDPEIFAATSDRSYEIFLYNRSDVDVDLIPNHTDMIRSWLFYQVWLDEKVDYIITLDDDVVPVGDPIQAYLDEFERGSVLSPYLSVGALTSSGLQMRGFPYKDRKPADVALQYGGWNGVLDYDAATQLAVPKGNEWFGSIVMPVPKGAALTGCIMNCALPVKYVPIMWQLPMLDGRFNRVGDIWSGLFAKKVLDVLGAAVLINGKAAVTHQRASDPYNSLAKEALSTRINDNLWDNLNDPLSSDMLEAYEEVTNHAAAFFSEHDKEYAGHFLKARDQWIKLFK